MARPTADRYCGLHITEPLRGSRRVVEAATAAEVRIPATAEITTGIGLLGSATKVQWSFPEIRGMTLELQPPSGMGLHVVATYRGPPSDGNPANGLSHLLGEPQFEIGARLLNCAISQSEDVVRIDVVFDHWEEYVYNTCRLDAFGTNTHYGDIRVLTDRGQKTVPSMEKLDLMLNAMWRSDTSYQRRNWYPRAFMTYGPEDFFASVALESDLNMEAPTQGPDAATIDPPPDAAIKDNHGWLDIGPGGVNYWQFNSRIERPLFRWAGFTTPADWERQVFGPPVSRVRDAAFAGSALENLAYAWWILGVRTHEGYNPGERNPSRIDKIDALRPQLRRFFDCLVRREYNYDLLGKVDSRRSMRLLGP